MTDLTNQIALVTGATGMVGNNLIRHLLDQGRPVRAFVRRVDRRSIRGLDVELRVGNVLDRASLANAMEGVGTVFHAAGAISIDGKHDDRMRQVNVEGTANVVEASLQAGAKRLVHFSSIHALSHCPSDHPIDERRALAVDPEKHLAYDVSKALAEQEVDAGVARGLDAVILNPVGIIGPHDFEPSPTGELIQQLMHRRLPGLVNAGYFWVDVRDVAQVAVAAERLGRCGEKYIVFSEYGTFQQLGKWVQQASGARPPRLNVPVWLAKSVAPWVVRYSRIRGIRPLVTPESVQIICCHQKIATRKAFDELGFRPRPFRETILDTVRWLQDDEASRAQAD